MKITALIGPAEEFDHFFRVEGDFPYKIVAGARDTLAELTGRVRVRKNSRIPATTALDVREDDEGTLFLEGPDALMIKPICKHTVTWINSTTRNIRVVIEF